jgi:hypothetical protein
VQLAGLKKIPKIDNGFGQKELLSPADFADLRRRLTVNRFCVDLRYLRD